MQITRKACDPCALRCQHIVDAGYKKFLILTVFQICGAGVGVGALILKIIRAADGIMADDLLFHRMADIAVRAVLQVAVGRGIALKGQQRPCRAIGKAALFAERIERAADKQVVAIIEKDRLTVRPSQPFSAVTAAPSVTSGRAMMRASGQ